MNMTSSDAFSFDNAAPAEGVESNAGSGMHSSPDGASSFSHVHSVSRSDTSKRSRNAIEDAARESRPVGRVQSRPTRSDRTPSTPRPTRVSAYRRTFHKPSSPRGSPRSKSGPRTADEELEARLKEMEGESLGLMMEMKEIEDEHLAERNQYQNMFQSAREEWQEFNNQYNHVIGCWRQAEERSRRFESEFMSEAMLFHEAKNGLQELQQHMYGAVQEDYGASLRINELERMILREREQFQLRADSYARETQQEFHALRGKAEIIRQEASEALAARDSQNFHDRELISDESMRLKGRNDVLVSEFQAAQNDVIKAGQIIHNEQFVIFNSKQILTEEEAVVQGLKNELSTAQSYLNIENSKNRNLQSRMEDDRMRYEQRLSVLTSHSLPREPSEPSLNIANKVETLRLRQELDEAMKTVAQYQESVVSVSSPKPPFAQEMSDLLAEEYIQSEKMEKTIKELRESRDEMEENAYQRYRDDVKDTYDERDRLRGKVYRLEGEVVAEALESRRLNEDVERLRNARNEWREWYDQATNWYPEEEAEHEAELAEERLETRTEESVAGSLGSEGIRLKITRKEADKIVIPNWPKIHELEFWKSQVTSSIVAASGDLEHDAWTAWIAPTFAQSPDIDGALSNSGDIRFNSIDVKLASSLMVMMQNGGEQAREVLNEARLKMAKSCRGDTPSIMKGRQLLAMIVDSFRSASNTDLVYTIRHLYDLPYPGDAELVTFKAQWNEVLECMRPGDVPNDVALRDILYDKIRGSKLMMFDIHYYDSKQEPHPDKTYKYLIDTINKHIKIRREEKNRDARNQGLKHMNSRFKNMALPTEEQPDKPSKAAPAPKPKAKPTSSPKSGNAAPVLADPKAKQHAKGKDKGKGKGKKGKGKSRSRSPSAPRSAADKKKIPCRFHFGVGTTCNKGRDCEFNHNSQSTPRANSPTGARKSVCYAFLQGKCTKGKDCKYEHDKKALAVVKSSVKAAAAPSNESTADTPRNADPKPSPKAKPKAKASAVALVLHSDDESDNESFCSDIVAVTEAGVGRLSQGRVRSGIKKDLKLKFSKRSDVIKYHVKTDKLWNKPSGRSRVGRKVSEKELRDRSRIEQIRYEEVRSMTRGLALERFIGNPKDGSAKASIDGTWKLEIAVSKNPKSSDLFIEKITKDEDDDNKGNSDLGYAYSTVKISKKMKFIMDTGCGYDLISHRKARELDLDIHEGNDRMVFLTANGITETREVAKCSVDSFQEEAKPFILEQTPAVLSVGMRCMKLGYTFVWPPNDQPFMINQSGKRISLHSKDDIPYLIPGNDSEPKDDKLASDIFELLSKGEVVADAPALAGEGEGRDDGDAEGEAEVPRGEEDEDEGEGVIEVDVHEGEPRMAKPGALKAEAKTMSHLLTHRYRNPYCQSCVRAKMKHFRTHRGAFKRVLKKWGDLITFDFADLEWTNYMGVPDERELLVIRDRFTGVIQAFPLRGKSTDDIIPCLKRFMGSRKVMLAFSDQAPQFVKACRELKITLDTSVPGRKVTNSLAERNIQFLVTATTTCLLEAGLPACYWTFAVTCVSHLLNIEELEDGSAWQKMHKAKFKGPMIPFGAKVTFKPSDARSRSQDAKFDPKGLVGVFAGYVVEAGNNWSRRMLVWNLQDFAKVNLAYDCEQVPMSLKRPHVTERVELDSPITFPLKTEYEKLNSTLEGVNTIADREGRPDVDDMIEDMDRPDDDDDEDPGYERTDDEGDDGPSDGDDRPPDGKPKDSKGRDIPEKREPLDETPDHYYYGKAGDGMVYLDDDGEWVKIDKRGRLYRVDKRDGRRIVRSTRPKDFTPEEWKSLSHEHRKALAEEYKKREEEKEDEIGDEHEEEPAKGEEKSRRRKKKKGKTKDDDHKAEIDELFKHHDIAASEAVTSEHETVDSVPSDCSTQFEDQVIYSFDEDQAWIEWEEFVEVINPVAASVPIEKHPPSLDNQGTPMMPCTHFVKDDHRERLGSSLMGSIVGSALVARPVGRKEMLNDPEALESMMKEWKGQWSAGVYDFKVVREYDDVLKEASNKGEEIHMARVHGICVEKHSELPKEDKRRKFKGRGVLLGNQVKNQNLEAAFFQDLGNSPASFESSRWADMFGCLPGHNVQLADAIQAYIQAPLSGVACWVELPDEAWPPQIERRKYRRPVVRLLRALYGHPDAGTMWEKHCDTAVKKLGFVPIGPNWPSMYHYGKLNLLLVVYVDDLKLAGPSGSLSQGWGMLRSLLNIEPETDLGMYLGCTLKKGENRLKDGTRVSTMTYDMESFLEQCVEKYREIAGKNVTFKHVATPSLPSNILRGHHVPKGTQSYVPGARVPSRAEALTLLVRVPKVVLTLQVVRLRFVGNSHHMLQAF